MTAALAAAARRLRLYGETVMFSHSVFSFSFAALAALTASFGKPGLRDSLLVCVAFLGGRTCANALNRVIDREIDARNPRTEDRHIPAGSIGAGETLGVALVSFAALSVAAYFLDPLCVALLPVAGALFVFYSFTKRFTWLCHFVLGAVCAGASVGAWIAMRGRIEWPVLALAAANAFWVMGFDIVYAIQDIDFDRKSGLKSIPARFGASVALAVSAVCHASAVLFLSAFAYVVGLGLPFYLACGAIAVILSRALYLAATDYSRKVVFASYSANQMVSSILLFGTAAEYAIGRTVPEWLSFSQLTRAAVEAFK